VVDAATGKSVAVAQYPETETEIISTQPGWAEQSPDAWWENVKQAILKAHSLKTYNPGDIKAIGIAYQMHGLVLVDKEEHVLRNSIIWCDSRAVDLGNEAFSGIGEEKCLTTLLNSPGNFTASKLAWIKENEAQVYDRVYKFMLPGDYICMKLTGEITTTISALSEGIFWDFSKNQISSDIKEYFGFREEFFPEVKPLFSNHGNLKDTVAERLSLSRNIPVCYKAGDQLNNALSLNVMEPGEVAATAGTSGVIYAVGNELIGDAQSRVNTFAHLNHELKDPKTGILLCINGAGIYNRWLKTITGSSYSYTYLNEEAARLGPGSEGIFAIPFGNGAERMLNNRIIGGHFHNLDFNRHSIGHLARAVQEGIAFSFRYGLDIMRENGIEPSVIRAGKANLFLSNVFTEAFVNATGVSIEFFEGDGSYGAAIGAGIGAGIFKNSNEALGNRKSTGIVQPTKSNIYNELYIEWKELLHSHLVKEGHDGVPVFNANDL
jgi:xylulokinase